jgi:hypothetical protein
VLALPEGLITWDSDGGVRFWSSAGKLRSGGNINAHRSAVEGVLALPGEVISWGTDNVVCRWDRFGAPIGAPWIAPAAIEFVWLLQCDVWVGLMGRPQRLLIGGPETPRKEAPAFAGGLGAAFFGSLSGLVRWIRRAS